MRVGAAKTAPLVANTRVLVGLLLLSVAFIALSAAKDLSCTCLEDDEDCKCRLRRKVETFTEGSGVEPGSGCDSVCSVNATCEAQSCVCVSGLTGNGYDCADIDECSVGSHRCNSSSMHCINTIGSYWCQCLLGYNTSSGTGTQMTTCIDVDECQSMLRPCQGQYQTCQNTQGSYRCNCLKGFTKTLHGNRSCEDENECSTGTHTCSNATCLNVIGSYDCDCWTGYSKGKTGQCLDIDECTNHRNNCSEKTNCVNNEGGYTCSCWPGYEHRPGNKTACQDINECRIKGKCGAFECKNTAGSFACKCDQPGYRTAVTGMCEDVDECFDQMEGEACTEKNTVCRNTRGSYECTCRDGFAQAPGSAQCEDVDECSARIDTCYRVEHAVCQNTPGSYRCPCNAGQDYEGNSTYCHKPTKITLLPPKKFAKVGQDYVEVPCKALGDPEPTIRWERRLKNGTWAFVKSLRGSLFIRNVNQSESGDYRCSAQNRITKDSNIVSLVVGDPSFYKVHVNLTHDKSKQPASEKNEEEICTKLDEVIRQAFTTNPEVASIVGINCNLKPVKGAVGAFMEVELVHGNGSILRKVESLLQKSIASQVKIDEASVKVSPQLGTTTALVMLKELLHATNEEEKLLKDIVRLWPSMEGKELISSIEEIVWKNPRFNERTTEEEVVTRIDVVERLEGLFSQTTKSLRKAYKKVSRMAFSTASDLLSTSNMKMIAALQRSSNTSARLVKLLEKMAAKESILNPTENLDGQTPYEVHQTSNLVKTIIDVPLEGAGLAFALQTASKPTSSLSIVRLTTSSLLDTANSSVSAILPRSLVTNAPCKGCNHNTRRVQLTLYNTSVFFQQFAGKKNGSAGPPAVANSAIVGVKVGLHHQLELKDPVKLVFSPRNGTASEMQCVYWDWAMFNGSGGWSSVGCHRVGLTATTVSCSCSHLTNFALLLAPGGAKETSEALAVVTIIGCSLSIAGLVLSLLYYLFVKVARATDQTRIIIGLLVNLLLLLIVFLVGIERTGSRTFCRGTALLLHYLLLSSFFWMAAEAYTVHLYVVQVFTVHVQHLFIKAALFANGLPLLFVLLPALADYDIYDNTDFCRMKVGAAFYATLVGPVVTVMVVNLVVFALAVRQIYNYRINGYSKVEKSMKMKRLRMSITLAVILGLSWLSGLALLENNHSAPQWVFAVLVSAQGFFIFFFMIVATNVSCVLLDDAKKVLRLSSSSTSNWKVSLLSFTGRKSSFLGRKGSGDVLSSQALEKTSDSSRTATDQDSNESCHMQEVPSPESPSVVRGNGKQ